MKLGEIVRGALLMLRVIDASEAVPAEHMQDGIAVLNSMMARWEANGVSVGWTDSRKPEDVAPVPPEAQEAVIAGLAVRLRTYYGVSIEPDVIQMANDGLALLRRDVRIASPIEWQRAGTYYDIRSDEYL